MICAIDSLVNESKAFSADGPKASSGLNRDCLENQEIIILEPTRLCIVQHMLRYLLAYRHALKINNCMAAYSLLETVLQK